MASFSGYQVRVVNKKLLWFSVCLWLVVNHGASVTQLWINWTAIQVPPEGVNVFIIFFLLGRGNLL